MKSPEELELELRDAENVPNWPGYNGRLELRELRHSDTPMLAPVLRSDRSNLSTYLRKFYGHKKWNIKSATSFVSGLLKQDWPALHWVAFIDGEPVGLISTAGVESMRECQLVIVVFSKHQGRGIAAGMTKTVLKITEEVFGFEKTWWHVDAANIPSIKVAQKLGFDRFDGYDFGESSKDASGYFHRFVRIRPHGLAPGILQGASMEYWWAAKDPALLRLIVDNKATKPTYQAIRNSSPTLDREP